MARDFFKLEKGIALTGENSDIGIKVTFGEGAPSANLEIGSVYIDSSSGLQYIKKLAGQGTDKWVASTNAADLAQGVQDAKDYADEVVGHAGEYLRKDGSNNMESDLSFSKASSTPAIPGVSFALDLSKYDSSKSYVVSVVADEGSSEASCVSMAESNSTVVITVKNTLNGTYLTNQQLANIVTTVLANSPVVATYGGTLDTTVVGYVANVSLSPYAKLKNLDAGVDSTDAINKGQLDAETYRAQGVESSLSQAILDEASRAAAAEQSLDSAVLKKDGSVALTGNLDLDSHKLVNVASGVDSTDGVNLGQVQDLIEAIPAVDFSGVDSAIASEVSRAQAAEQSLSSSLAEEASRAMAMEQSLQSQISFISSNVDPAAIDSLTELLSAYQAADGSLAQAVNNLTDTETSRAMAAEQSLANAIANEASRAGVAEQSLAQSIQDEVSRAGAAEQSLAQAITNAADAEASRAQAAEQSLSQAIVDEVTRAQVAEASLAQSISDVAGDLATEVTRAGAAEQSLSQALSAEISRATGAESSISQALVEEVTRAQIAEESLSQSILDEVSRSGAAEDSLSQAIVDEASRAQAAEALAFLKDGSRNLTGSVIPDVPFNPMDNTGLDLGSGSAPFRAISVGTVIGGIMDAAPGLDGLAFNNKKLLYVAAGTATTDAVNKGQLDAEISRAQAAEGSVAQSVVDEASRAGAAEQSLADAIAAEASRATGVEDSLSQDISDEVTRAQIAEQSLAQSISDEISRAMSAESSLSDQIDSSVGEEMSRAQLAEQSLAQSVLDEKTRAQIAESSLSDALSSEISRAMAMEQSLQSQVSFIASNIDPVAIDSLTELLSAYQAADGSLSQAINSLTQTEVSRAQAAEQSLAQSISDEISRAQAAEDSLNTAILAEISRAQAAEDSLDSAVSDEVSRAQAAEGSLNTAILAEISRAQAAEDSLDSAVSDEVSRAQAAEGSLNTAILDEASRALAAEASLADAIANIPVTKHIAGPITTTAMVDSVSTKTTSAARWFVVARMIDNPNWVKSVEIFAMHDGTNTGDATDVDYNQFSKLSVGTDFDVSYDVVLIGTGDNQKMELQASSTETNGVKISATQVWLPDGAI